jgi:hypothetical protein
MNPPTIQTVFPDKPETHRPGEFGTIISEVVLAEGASAADRVLGIAGPPEAVAAVVEVCEKEGYTVVEGAATAAEITLADIVAQLEKQAALQQPELVKAMLAKWDDLIAMFSPKKGPAHGERKHHKNSPSTLDAKNVCPGAYQRSGVSNARAEFGTMLHEACDSGDYSKLLDEELDVVLSCLDFVNERNAEFGPDPILLQEDYLPIDDRKVNGKDDPTSAGYLDRGIVARDFSRAAVRDFKFGLNPVTAADKNLQGITYSLGLLRWVELKFGVEARKKIKEIDVDFIMPYIGPEGTISTHTFKAEEFNRLYLQVCLVVAKAERMQAIFEEAENLKTPHARRVELLNSIEPELNPTESGCLFCGRLAICPAVGRMALSVSDKYEPLKVPGIINPSLVGTPEEAASALKFYAVMKELCESYRMMCTNRAVEDENWTPVGYSIVPSVRRTIIDKQKFYDTIRPLLSESDFLNSIDFTFGPVEEAVQLRAPRGKKKAALQELKDLLRVSGATEESDPIYSLHMDKKTTKTPSES